MIQYATGGDSVWIAVLLQFWWTKRQAMSSAILVDPWVTHEAGLRSKNSYELRINLDPGDKWEKNWRCIVNLVAVGLEHIWWFCCLKFYVATFNCWSSCASSRKYSYLVEGLGTYQLRLMIDVEVDKWREWNFCNIVIDWLMQTCIYIILMRFASVRHAYQQAGPTRCVRPPEG